MERPEIDLVRAGTDSLQGRGLSPRCPQLPFVFQELRMGRDGGEKLLPHG